MSRPAVRGPARGRGQARGQAPEIALEHALGSTPEGAPRSTPESTPESTLESTLERARDAGSSRARGRPAGGQPAPPSDGEPGASAARAAPDDDATAEAEHAQRIDALARWLADQAPEGQPVERIQTHLSTLLLAGDRVFKLKRPRRLAFVDFRPLAQRRRACLAELRLNRRTAPDHYLAVRPLLASVASPSTAGGVRLGEALPAGGRGGAAPVLDWVLEMRRFDARQGFDRLAREGRLSVSKVEALADALVRFHQRLPPQPHAPGAAPPALRALVLRNLQELRAVAPPSWGPRLDALGDWLQRRGAALARTMAARGRAGCVREVHGDLHLANVAWLAEAQAPLIFDALEFDPALRHTDTVGDTAFLFMDLLARGRHALAWAFLNRVLTQGADVGALPLLPWWGVHRALVRAKVAWLSPGGSGQDPADGGGRSMAALARRYLRTAESLAAMQPLAAARAAAGALHPAHPAHPGDGPALRSARDGPALRSAPAAGGDSPWRAGLVVMLGLSGSGKSVAARAIGQALGAVVWRSDVERKRLFGRQPLERPAPGDPIYGRRANARTYARLAALLRQSLAAGFHTVVDAACLRRAERQALAAAAAGHPRGLLWCDAPPARLARRIQARARAGQDPSDATPAVLALQQQRLEPPGPDEQAALARIDSGASPAATGRAAVAAARRWLKPPQGRRGRAPEALAAAAPMATAVASAQRRRARRA